MVLESWLAVPKRKCQHTAFLSVLSMYWYEVVRLIACIDCVDLCTHIESTMHKYSLPGNQVHMYGYPVKTELVCSVIYFCKASQARLPAHANQFKFKRIWKEIN